MASNSSRKSSSTEDLPTTRRERRPSRDSLVFSMVFEEMASEPVLELWRLVSLAGGGGGGGSSGGARGDGGGGGSGR